MKRVDSREDSYMAYALYIVRSSPLSLVGLILVAIILILAFFSPLIAPYDPNQVLIGAPGHALGGGAAGVAYEIRPDDDPGDDRDDDPLRQG